MSKKFETYADALVDPMCAELIVKVLQKIQDERRSILRNVKSPGVRLKSSAFSTLQDMGLLNDVSILKEFIEIQNKRSTIPSRERSFIQSIVMNAMIQTIAHYDAEEYKEATKIASESRKKRKKSVKAVAVEGEGGG